MVKEFIILAIYLCIDRIVINYDNNITLASLVKAQSDNINTRKLLSTYLIIIITFFYWDKAQCLHWLKYLQKKKYNSYSIKSIGFEYW